MKSEYLIILVEEFCQENKLDISKVYKKMAEIYQGEYGINIVMQMEADGYHGMPEYLESRGIVDRYISILNKMKRGEY
jgi:hypothetical protein